MFSPRSFIILGLTLRFMIQLELIFVCGLSVGLRLISCIWLPSHPSTICWRLSFLWSLPRGSDGEESACNVGDLSSIPGLGRFPGGEDGNPLQYSSLKNPYGQRSLVGYSPWVHKESDTTERLSTHTTE